MLIKSRGNRRRAVKLGTNRRVHVKTFAARFNLTILGGMLWNGRMRGNYGKVILPAGSAGRSRKDYLFDVCFNTIFQIPPGRGSNAPARVR